MIWPSDFCLWPQTVSPPNRCCCGFGWWRCRGGVGRLGRRRCCRWRCSGRFRRGRGRCGRGRRRRRRCGRRPGRLRWFRRWLGRRLWRSALRSRGRRGRAPLRTAAAWAAVAALAADARFSVLWRRWALASVRTKRAKDLGITRVRQGFLRNTFFSSIFRENFLILDDPKGCIPRHS